MTTASSATTAAAVYEGWSGRDHPAGQHENRGGTAAHCPSKALAHCGFCDITRPAAQQHQAGLAAGRAMAAAERPGAAAYQNARELAGPCRAAPAEPTAAP